MRVEVSPLAVEDDWAVGRGAVDEANFQAGRVGPYRLGKRVRKTAFGELVLAIDPRAESILEIDLLDALARTPLTAPDGLLMGDLAQAATIRHRHVAPIVGSGFEDGVPYVVRPHRLGRTLAELIERAGPGLEPDAAAAILYSVADALEGLAQEGPQPGACAMGGFDDRDVFLGFDGSTALTGVGLKQARPAKDEDPVAADLTSAFALARLLDLAARAGLSSAIAGAQSAADLTRAVRRRFGPACAGRRRFVAAALRIAFEDALREERAYFGLAPLQ